MSKFRSAILVFGIIILCIGASLATYFTLAASGSLASDAISLVIALQNEEKPYDGTPLQAQTYALQSGELRSGDQITLEPVGSQTDVGTSFGNANVRVTNKKGKDVSSDYSVTVLPATLEVYKASLSVELPDCDVLYSGEKILFDEYRIRGGKLAEGHSVGAVRANAGKVEVGTFTSSDLYPAVYDASGRNVSENYSIDFTMGTVRIIPRPVTFRPVAVEKTYDGMPVTATQYVIESGSLATGHYAQVEINFEDHSLATMTDAGSRQIYIGKAGIFYDVAASGGEIQPVDVSKNYSVKTLGAAMTVKKKDLTVTAKSETWEFDGTEHSFIDDPEPYSCVGLVEGETASLVNVSSITNVGKCDNIPEGVTVTNRYGQDSSGNYNPSIVKGTLTVTRASLTIWLNEIVTQQNPYTGDNIGALIRQTLVSTGQSMFKSDKDISGIVAVSERVNSVLQSLVDAGEVTCTLSDLRLYIKNEDGSRGEECTNNFNIDRVPGVITVTPRELTSVSFAKAQYQKEYDGFAYPFGNGDIVVSGLLSERGHRVDSVTCTSETMASDTAREVRMSALKIVNDRGMDISGNYTYRSMPVSLIPNVTAQLIITKRTLEVSSPSVTKEYDGSPVYGGAPVASGLAVGDFLNYSREPSLTNVGTIPNDYTYTVVNSQGRDVTDCYNRQEPEFGTITVNKRSLTIKTPTVSKVYDGKTLALSKGDIKITGLMQNDSVDYKGTNPTEMFTSLVNVGSATNKPVYYAIMRDGENVTDNYDVTEDFGTLTITKRSVAVTMGNETVEYSGRAFHNEANYYYSKLELDSLLDKNWFSLQDARGNEIDATRIVDAGTYEIIPVLKADADMTTTLEGETVRLDPDNFDWLITAGSVTVKKVLINVTLNPDPSELEEVAGPVQINTKKYDGKPLTLQNILFAHDMPEQNKTIHTLIPVSSSLEGKTNAGVYNYTAEFKVYANGMAGEEGIGSNYVDVTRNYEIAVDTASFTIESLTVTLQYDGDVVSKTYDGKPFELDLNQIAIFGEGILGRLVDFVVASATYTQVVKVGDNQEIMLTDVRFMNLSTGTYAGSDSMYANLGQASFVSVSITPRNLTLTVDSITVNYDPASGESPYRLKADVLSSMAHVSSMTPLAEGDTIVDLTAYISSSSTTGNLTSDYGEIRNKNGEDVTACYEINDEAQGQITVNKYVEQITLQSFTVASYGEITVEKALELYVSSALGAELFEIVISEDAKAGTAGTYTYTVAFKQSETGDGVLIAADGTEIYTQFITLNTVAGRITITN